MAHTAAPIERNHIGVAIVQQVIHQVVVLRHDKHVGGRAQTMNQQIEEYQPWTKAKEGDPQLKAFLQTIIKTTIFLFYYLKPWLTNVTSEQITT